MSTAELNKKKLNIIAWINKLSDENTIDFLDALKSSTTTSDWYHELSESQKEIIQKGLDDSNTNQVIASSEFWNRLRNE